MAATSTRAKIEVPGRQLRGTVTSFDTGKVTRSPRTNETDGSVDYSETTTACALVVTLSAVADQDIAEIRNIVGEDGVLTYQASGVAYRIPGLTYQEDDGISEEGTINVTFFGQVASRL